MEVVAADRLVFGFLLYKGMPVDVPRLDEFERLHEVDDTRLGKNPMRIEADCVGGTDGKRYVEVTTVGNNALELQQCLPGAVRIEGIAVSPKADVLHDTQARDRSHAAIIEWRCKDRPLFKVKTGQRDREPPYIDHRHGHDSGEHRDGHVEGADVASILRVSVSYAFLDWSQSIADAGGPLGPTIPAAPSNLQVSPSAGPCSGEVCTTNLNYAWQDNSNNEDGLWLIITSTPTYGSPTVFNIQLSAHTTRDTFSMQSGGNRRQSGSSMRSGHRVQQGRRISTEQ
jgi:hypothetical protein